MRQFAIAIGLAASLFACQKTEQAQPKSNLRSAGTERISDTAVAYQWVEVPRTQWGHKSWSFISLPAGYSNDSARTYPTIIYFHSHAVSGTDTASFVANSVFLAKIKSGWKPVGNYPYTTKRDGFIVIAALGEWGPLGATDMAYAMDYLKGKVKIDTTRIYTMGPDLGGAAASLYATWNKEHGKKVAAVVAVDPHPDMYQKTGWDLRPAAHYGVDYLIYVNKDWPQPKAYDFSDMYNTIEGGCRVLKYFPPAESADTVFTGGIDAPYYGTNYANIFDWMLAQNRTVFSPYPFPLPVE